MITMYDAVTIENIPDEATVVAGYVDGTKVKPTFDNLCARFPHARQMSIAVFAEHDAECLDVEPGDARPDQVPGWLRRQRENGAARPVIYADLTRMKEVLTVLDQAGIATSSVRLWTAHYTGHPHVCGPRPGGCGELPVPADGTQFTKTAHGLDLDQSLLNDDFFGRAEPQIQSPPPSVFTVQSPASLAQLAQNTLHNAVSMILRLTAEHSPGAVFTERMAGYLNDVFAADKEKVPEGITVYHPDGNGSEPFVSSGHQTLQGLALAFTCQPSAIVRLTAEQSPGAIFGAGMADYLNDVFSRSTTPVPEGIHLFHQK